MNKTNKIWKQLTIGYCCWPFGNPLIMLLLRSTRIFPFDPKSFDRLLLLLLVSFSSMSKLLLKCTFDDMFRVFKLNILLPFRLPLLVFISRLLFDCCWPGVVFVAPGVAGVEFRLLKLLPTEFCLLRNTDVFIDWLVDVFLIGLSPRSSLLWNRFKLFLLAPIIFSFLRDISSICCLLKRN